MPSPAAIDIASFLPPIPGDEPSGGRTPLVLRQRMEIARKEFEPNPQDPSAAPVPKKPDWSGIVKIATEVLTQRSKDLEVSLRLTEALTRQHGFPGLRDGFRLLRELTLECWDRLHPIPDAADGEGMEIRAERFNWIGDNDAGARFPNAIREINVFNIKGSGYSLKDRQIAAEGRGEIQASEFEHAQPLSDLLIEDLREALEAFEQLDQALQEKLGNQSPGLVGLRQVFDELRDSVLRLADRNQSSSAEADASSSSSSSAAGGSQSSGGSGSGGGDAVRTREDAYRQVGQIADMLERLEPHSPIPDLLRKAVTLGRMSFRELLIQMVRDDAMRADIRREFGIKEETSE